MNCLTNELVAACLSVLELFSSHRHVVDLALQLSLELAHCSLYRRRIWLPNDKQIDIALRIVLMASERTVQIRLFNPWYGFERCSRQRRQAYGLENDASQFSVKRVLPIQSEVLLIANLLQEEDAIGFEPPQLS